MLFSPPCGSSDGVETFFAGALTREEGFLTTGDFAGELFMTGEVEGDCAASAAAAAARERGVPVVGTTFLGPAPPPVPLPLDTAGDRFPFVLVDELDRALSNPSVPKLDEKTTGLPRRDLVGEAESDRPLPREMTGDWEGVLTATGEEGVTEVEIRCVGGWVDSERETGESTRGGRDLAIEEAVGPAGPVEADELERDFAREDGEVDSMATSGGERGAEIGAVEEGGRESSDTVSTSSTGGEVVARAGTSGSGERESTCCDTTGIGGEGGCDGAGFEESSASVALLSSTPDFVPSIAIVPVDLAGIS